MSQENLDEDFDEENENLDEEKEKYDTFNAILRDISRFNVQYRSFTTGKTYTNLLGKTATGLLKDAAAETRKLSAQEIKQHKYSQEVFAAFCMYFCITKITSSFKKADLTLALDTVSTVYGRVLKHIKNELETTGKSLFVRNLIKLSAKNAMLDLVKVEDRYLGLDDGSSDDMEKELNAVPEKVRVVLYDGAAEAMRKDQLLTALISALAQAGEKGILTKNELYAICCYYELGDGFKKLSNHEVAVKFGCSDAKATKLRKRGIQKLLKYIQNTPELREEFLR